MSANATMVNDHELPAAASMHGAGSGSKAATAFKRWFEAIGNIGREVVARRRARSAAIQLARLSDGTLKDIGISRGEILSLADELASGRSNGMRPIRYRSDGYQPARERS